MYRKILGERAENIAKKKLISLGYKIIETNFRCKVGEIDIIAQEKGTIVFVEVRSRKESYFGLPQETINLKKQDKIRKVAQYYLKVNGITDADCRFDVVAITFKPQMKVDVICNAF